MRIVVRAVDVNTGEAIVDAVVNLGGATGTTNWNGEAQFQADPGTYSLRILHGEYTPYKSARVKMMEAGTYEVEMVPRVGLL